MILVDSSVWIDYFNARRSRETDLLDELLGSEVLVTGDLIVTEVLQGFADDRDLRRARRALEALAFEPMVGHNIAVASAINYRRLRARGITVRKTTDCLIATFCVRGGHSLLHCDRDFDPFEQLLGLSVVHVAGQRPETS